MIFDSPRDTTLLTVFILFLRVGIRGIMLAALLSALMSSLTSIFNGTSTMFTLDIWKRFRKNCKESELMIVGKNVRLEMQGACIPSGSVLDWTIWYSFTPLISYRIMYCMRLLCGQSVGNCAKIATTLGDILCVYAPRGKY